LGLVMLAVSVLVACVPRASSHTPRPHVATRIVFPSREIQKSDTRTSGNPVASRAHVEPALLLLYMPRSVAPYSVLLSNGSFCTHKIGRPYGRRPVALSRAVNVTPLFVDFHTW